VSRGWESKSVEQQIASAKERHVGPREKLTPEQMDNERKCDSILLQRTRMMRQLETCAEGRYRQTLEGGLAFLEKQLKDLGWRG